MTLAFETLAQQNLIRCERWHPRGIQDWSLCDWLLAFGGEAGEALNAGKKYKRIESGVRISGIAPTDLPSAAKAIMEELADTVIYADLVAQRLGLSLGQAVRSKFNAISQREDFPERL